SAVPRWDRGRPARCSRGAMGIDWSRKRATRTAGGPPAVPGSPAVPAYSPRAPHLCSDARMHGPLKLDMPLEEAMSTQRAIRPLKPDPVDDALVLHLIELALKAPTGSNAQNWEFIVVRDPAVRAKLARLNRRAWNLYGGLGRRLYGKDERMAKILNAV